MTSMTFSTPNSLVDSITDQDSLVLLSREFNDKIFSSSVAQPFIAQLATYRENVHGFDREGAIITPIGIQSSIKRVVYSPLGPLNRDFDDVRRFQDAAISGVTKAIKAGGKRILVVLANEKYDFETADYSLAALATVLGAYEAVYVPLEIREAIQSKCKKVESISFSISADSKVLAIANAIEQGRYVARDIGGSDPERMSAPNVAAYIQQVFEGTNIQIKIIDDKKEIEKQFPCLGAVNRGSMTKHLGRVILLTYEPQEPTKVKQTLGFVGKGVTFDTGGHDIKAGGHMAGMHRDKCGAAAVAGLFKTLSVLKPSNVRVLGALAMVRNSVGPEAYVADELITSRAGVRVRVGNTDAEGRMAMVDLLAYLKEQLLTAGYANPQLFTVATLTGHACLVSGNYTMVLDNGPARRSKVAQRLIEAGERIGDSCELSTIRREDYEFCQGKSEYEQVLQCNNLASSRTPRGHQFPAAFLAIVSGVDQHGLDSDKPIGYTHIDIAASSGPFPGIPSGSPIAALTVNFFLE